MKRQRLEYEPQTDRAWAVYEGENPVAGSGGQLEVYDTRAAARQACRHGSTETVREIVFLEKKLMSAAWENKL